MRWFFCKPTAAPESQRPAPTPTNVVVLQSLDATMLHALAGLENAAVDLELLRARLADLCRDQQAEPLDADHFMKQAQSLDAESQRRLALAVRGLEDGMAQRAFTRPGATSPAARVEGLFAFAREHLLLTVSLLHESPLRREEFARHFVAHFGGEFLGETPQDSADRLRRLDYRTLLGEAEKAKVSAQDRVAHLRRLQEEQEKLLGRRSKF